MSPIHRRGFMKTCLAGVTSASLVMRRTPEFHVLAAEESPHAGLVTLEHGDQQLRVSEQGAPFCFQNFLRVADQWKPATLPGIPLVTGPSFPLVASQISTSTSRIVASGSATAEDLGKKSVSYDWKAEISALTPEADLAWLRFEITLNLTRPIRLQQGTQIEPQIMVWLNLNSTLMEGQSGSWRRVLLQQPTRNSLGAWGNDLPALYLLDQNVGVETMMFFDVGEMSWMSIENVPRFLVYRCSSISRIERDGTQRLGVGLIADQATGDVLPAGEVRFTYWLLQRSLTELLTEQEAVSRWMRALLPLFEEKLGWPRCAGAWKDFAAGTIANLQQKSETQIEAAGHTGLRAYVKETSKLWQQPKENFELMAVADVLWPFLLYLRLHPSSALELECKQFIDDLPGFYHDDTHSISNDYVRHANERADSWYPFENGLIKYPMIASLTGSEETRKYFLDAFATAEKIAHQYNYLFPIYYEVATLLAQGAGTNYAVGGLYAWAALIANRLTGETKYRDQAQRAIQVLCTVPSDRLFHEPQELAYGALAAAELGMHPQAQYLLFEQLRMFYWYSDSSQKNHDIRGMVQAAASILYPAFKENVEAILPWTGVMKRGLVFEALLRFMDQQRRNNFYFFEKCTEGRGNISMGFIPFENLGTLELGGQTGNVGKEIYGAGECIWMYLMFEALGQVSDRELMLVNLDLLDIFDAKDFPPRRLNFILYNPTSQHRRATISIPPANGGSVRIIQNGTEVSNKLNVPPRAIFRFVVEFDSDSW
ncbi:MAG: hypothetical protein WBV55_17810 [Candidatus Sulfotelmatobacter sp.]